MHYWEDDPSILAGRDLQQNGTWLGIHKSGKFGALTNYRDPAAIKSQAPSRGEIIVDFLHSNLSPGQFLEQLRQTGQRYNGFNLLLSDLDTMFCYSNVSNEIIKVVPGIHGLSNHLLDTAWPKVRKGKEYLKSILFSNQEVTFNRLFNLLGDKDIPDDSQLPETGVGLEWERILAPLFISSATYGTRSSTALIMDKKNRIYISERNFDPDDSGKFEDFDFVIQPI